LPYLHYSLKRNPIANVDNPHSSLNTLNTRRVIFASYHPTGVASGYHKIYNLIMVTPKRYFLNNCVYHIYNRGTEKRDIFLDKFDYHRFLETLVYYQDKNNLCRFSYSNHELNLAASHNQFDILNFCLMPNHFHLLLSQANDDGVSLGISKLLNSYTRYFNTKYQRVGSLFQGVFQSVPVLSDEQLIHTARYIFLNPLVDHLVDKLPSYKWSSYNEYFSKVISNPPVCNQEMLLRYFDGHDSFQRFVTDFADFARSKKDMKRLFLDS